MSDLDRNDQLSTDNMARVSLTAQKVTHAEGDHAKKKADKKRRSAEEPEDAAHPKSAKKADGKKERKEKAPKQSTSTALVVQDRPQPTQEHLPKLPLNPDTGEERDCYVCGASGRRLERSILAKLGEKFGKDNMIPNVLTGEKCGPVANLEHSKSAQGELGPRVFLGREIDRVYYETMNALRVLTQNYGRKTIDSRALVVALLFVESLPMCVRMHARSKNEVIETVFHVLREYHYDPHAKDREEGGEKKNGKKGDDEDKPKRVPIEDAPDHGMTEEAANEFLEAMFATFPEEWMQMVATLPQPFRSLVHKYGEAKISEIETRIEEALKLEQKRLEKREAKRKAKGKESPFDAVRA